MYSTKFQTWGIGNLLPISGGGGSGGGVGGGNIAMRTVDRPC